MSQIAAKNDVPCVILRAMSDNADEDGHEVLVVKKFSITEYVATATKIVAAMVESLILAAKSSCRIFQQELFLIAASKNLLRSSKSREARIKPKRLAFFRFDFPSGSERGEQPLDRGLLVLAALNTRHLLLQTGLSA